MLYRWCFFVMQREVIAQFFDLNEWVLFDLVSPMFWLVGLCVAVRVSNFGAMRWPAVAVGLGLPIVLFATEVSPTFERDHTRLGGDIAFVRDFVRERESSEARHVSVYSPYGRADLLWIDVRATSYFSIMQTAGVMFNRPTAEEIQRRCVLVSKFEMARQREEMLFFEDGKKAAMENLFKVAFDCPAPSRGDLVRLCNEPGLDYVVIPQEFPDLYSATNGRIFVYECYKVRTADSSFSARVAPRGR
jgi:hypothetical protein